MKRLLLTLGILLALGTVWAQRNVTVSGVVEAAVPLPDNARVGVHVINSQGVTLDEVTSVRPVAGTFSLTTEPLAPGLLQPWRSGGVPLPGLQTDYTITPDNVNYARAVTKVYLDDNANGGYEPSDPGYLGVVQIEGGGGFFVLLYVDKAATLSGRGATLNLVPGWNIFTARTQAAADGLVYGIEAEVNNALLDVFIQ
ncbi:MAG: hypothetical protein U5L04_03070 [Trueperaceae bacterium]|nr:hypothetical protein [Trueperaceae bacterium]